MIRNAFAMIVAIGLLAALGFSFFQQVAAPAAQPDVIVGRDGWLFPGWDRMADERPGDTERAVARVTNQIRVMEQRGIRVVVLLIPNKVRVHVAELPPEMQKRVRASKGFENLARKLREAKVDLVTAWPSFVKQDSHWTAVSAEQAALAVASKLEARGISPPDGVARKLGVWRTQRRTGDLVDLLRRRGDLRFDKSDFRIRSYVEPANRPAFVELVGNSFIDDYLGFGPRLALAIGGNVATRMQQTATGPWVAMDAALADRSSRTQFIVWQLQEASFSIGLVGGSST